MFSGKIAFLRPILRFELMFGHKKIMCEVESLLMNEINACSSWRHSWVRIPDTRSPPNPDLLDLKKKFQCDGKHQECREKSKHPAVHPARAVFHY